MARAGIAPNQKFTLGGATFIIHTRLEDNRWQVRNVLTGEWVAFPESDLLRLYQDRELVFEVAALDEVETSQRLKILLKRSLATFPENLVQKAERVLKYLIRLDCHRNNGAPIQSLAPKSLQQFIDAAAAEFEDPFPPSTSKLHVAYSRWIAGGRDIRAVIAKHEKRGNRLPRLPAEVLRVARSKIVEVLTCREKRTSRHVLDAVKTELSELNKHRDSSRQLPIPCMKTVTRMIAKIPRYELAVMQHGKRFADVEYRSTGRGPTTTRPLEQVEIDHTPIDCIVVDETTGLPLGRPWITSILDRYSKCCIGFSIDYGGPSTRSIMRAFKNAILPKTYVKEKYPTIENEWPCYGLWSLLVADNGKDFLSDEVMRVSSDLGFDLLYGPPRMGSFKGAIERFQRTLNEQNMHPAAGTTLSKYIDLKDYNPRTTAVITLQTLQEEIHRWIIDVYHQDVHGTPGYIPVHRWTEGMKMMTVPLPAARVDLDRVVGLHRYGRVWHYGMDFLKLKYNSSELQDLRCQFGKKISLERVIDFDDLGRIHVIHPVHKTYIAVPATYPELSTGISVYQQKLILKLARIETSGCVDNAALRRARETICSNLAKKLKLKKPHITFTDDLFIKSANRPFMKSSPKSNADLSFHPAPSSARAESADTYEVDKLT
ncbi:DDE-type integrase/transposase/recombinase [Granulicella sp. S156]|uniref:DDE-type integrase/transposase/recombinase n=1 Tax=Granulicella sp. S156 TaxID=1747224 RepID=UPI00131E3921|nr:DDE-type integrase/transposase/recombinase [Granulicella sp. S156]